MSTVIYIGFYTEGTGYEDEAKELIKTLIDFNLEYEIEAIPNRGDWQKNTQHKAVFIREKMDQHPNQALVWVDADARIRQYPSLFCEIAETNQCDIAVHYHKEAELLSGTMYIAPTPAARRTVDLWIERNAKYPGVWDQKNLQWVMEETNEARLMRLPAEYCFIFDLSKKYYPGTLPIIEHMQASRRLKKRANAIQSPMKALMAINQQAEILNHLPAGGAMLEWGSGGTTKQLLLGMQTSQRLVSVEHHAEWAAKVEAECRNCPNHEILVKESTGGVVGKNATQWEECPVGLAGYIYPCDLSEFDVFLVDGVARGSCLMSVFTYGKSGAWVFLHDANRPWYEWALQHPRILEKKVIEASVGDYPPLLWMAKLQ